MTDQKNANISPLNLSNNDEKQTLITNISDLLTD